jgi:uncharacterized protein YdaU (DUF1376 family)
MARAFIAYYVGDYQKKTQHLDTLQHGAYKLLLDHCWVHGSIPLDAASRANICKMTLPAWKKIAPVINAFFDEEGRNKRATEEIEKAERISVIRSAAGRGGGIRSGISKAIAKGQQLRSNEIANASSLPKQTRQQTPKQNSGLSIPSQNPSITSSFPDLAREDGRPFSAESHRLLASLDRIRAAKQAPKPAEPSDEPSTEGGVWVAFGTPEWNAHAHYAASRGIRMRLPIEITEDGVARKGAHFDRTVPAGYDEATGEKLPTKAEDAA